MIDTQEMLLTAIAEEGMSYDELLEEYGMSSSMPGVCSICHEGWFGPYEPDQDKGWCENCEKQSVWSYTRILGLV